MTPVVDPDLVDVITGFAAALRTAGVEAYGPRVTACLTALGYVETFDIANLYWASRLAFCSERDDLPLFDAVFDTWFRGLGATQATWDSSGRESLLPVQSPSSPQNRGVKPLEVASIDTEVLRHRNMSDLTDAERDEVNRMIALLRPGVRNRRSARRVHGGGDRVDVHRTIREMLRNGGEVEGLLRSHRRKKLRRLVHIIDVSGSMAPYADALLRFTHASVRVAPSATEVFTISTHLTRVTKQLRLRDPEEAVTAAGQAVPDWNGGTRLGETLREFLDLWGQRGMARGAVVVVASDGRERGSLGSELLGGQVARLARLARCIIWMHPYRTSVEFRPIGGMLAAVRSIDHLVAGHNFDAFEAVAELLARV